MAVKKSYVGMAGQLFVMSELAFRGYNVATPAVDEGDDVFITDPNTGQLTRGQVKTSNGTRRGAGNISGYSGQFRVPVTQMNNAAGGVLYYFLVCRCSVGDTRFAVIERAQLRELHETDLIGTPAGDYVQFSLNFRETGEVWTGVNVQAQQVRRTVQMNNCFPVIEAAA